jgi:hypothetical protein
MRIPARAVFLLLIPTVLLLKPNITTAAAPTPSAERIPGVYIGWINMTIMHQFSASAGPSSTSFNIDMINSTGSLEIQLLSDNSNYIHVELPVPIDFRTSVDSGDEKAECRGWTITGSAHGKAAGTAINAPLLPLGSYTLSVMTFGLGSLSGQYSPNGKCPSWDWKASSREGLSADFINIFGDGGWSFTASKAGYTGMSGRCENFIWGKSKGQRLECSWRVFRVSNQPAK